MKQKTIAMAGGGTGGHVFPIESLIQTLLIQGQTPLPKVIRFGTDHSLEEQIAQKYAQVRFQTICSGKLRREKTFKSFLLNVRDVFLFLIGCVQSVRYLLKYHVDTVFCKGGYVALPVVIAAWILRKKIIVHESDTHAGLVNRIASKCASKTFTGFENVLSHSETIGQILSDQLLTTGEFPESLLFLKMLDPKKPFLFIMGGSQGAKSVYEALIHIWEQHPDICEAYEIALILGKLNQDLKPQFPHSLHLLDFVTQEEMGFLYQKADVCISRGGTTSLAEQKVFHIPTIIIPIPRTHDQKENAKYFVTHYQDIALDQEDPNFEIQLLQALEKYAKKKKEKSDIDYEKIKIPKQKILHELLYS